MEENNLLKQNLDFFEKELLPYYIILHTANGSLVIETKETNLKHLLGVGYAELPLRNIKSSIFFEELKKDNYNLFDLIDYERYESDKLKNEEEMIYNKNFFFIEIFKNLISSPNIYLYRKPNNNYDFKTDYLHFKLNDECGLYIGIIGHDDNHYHSFNSIIAERKKPEKYLTGSRISVTKIERVPKESFDPSNYNFLKSKHYQIKSPTITKEKPRNMKQLKDKINQILLKSDIKITVGMYGKNTIQIFKNGKQIETNAKIPSEMKSVQEISKYIIDNYTE